MNKFCTKYDHVKPVSPAGGVSLTDQQYKDECDIDVIMKRYRIGQPLPVTTRKALCGDFSDFGDFMDCLNKVSNARQEFAELPAVLRARFGNDPVAFYKFCLDPSNQAECVRLGLRQEIAKPVVIPPEKAENPVSTSAGSSAVSTT